MHQFFLLSFLDLKKEKRKEKKKLLIEFVESNTRIGQMKQTSIIELTFALEWGSACM